MSHSTVIQKNFTPCLHEWKWYERTSEKKTSSNLPTSYMNAYVRFSLHVLFEIPHPDFLLMALQCLLSQKLVIFFTSMIPIVLIEAITSPFANLVSMESFDHHGQSTTTIFHSCTSISLTHFHHSGASPRCPPGDFQQPLSTAPSAPTFGRLIPHIIPCHISLFNSP